MPYRIGAGGVVQEQGGRDERGGVDQRQDEDGQPDRAAEPAGERLGAGGERAVDAGSARPFLDPGERDVGGNGHIGVEAEGDQMPVRRVVEVVGGAEGREEGQDRDDRGAGDQEEPGVGGMAHRVQAGEQTDRAERESGGGQRDDQMPVRLDPQPVRRPGRTRQSWHHGRRTE
ncbi:hypothetical protein Acor_72260 [Acrocarpospora corrugata]|uniref:Uncharacterized protein n=1 Tax=Acrocarpospora corrugata TaxID=35763 RepID=A0A5M3WFJ8_9ACTN|nr:hypothetical protein Acor_72260 [Acrocarpospora corrugata]